MNNNNIFLNLSHILLRKIINYIYDNFDRISLSLVCRKLFYDRDKYFKLNSETLSSKTEIDSYLKSYHQYIEKAKKSKSNDTLYVGHRYEINDFLNRDFYCLVTIPLIIPSSISKIIVSPAFKINLVDLKEILEQSNVNHLNFNSFKLDLKPNYFSSTIKCLELHGPFNQRFDRDFLPPQLEHLILGYSYDQPFEPNVLPASLKKLELGYSYRHLFKKGSLPLNLEELHFTNSYKLPIPDEVFPPNLHTLINVTHETSTFLHFQKLRHLQISVMNITNVLENNNNNNDNINNNNNDDNNNNNNNNNIEQQQQQPIFINIPSSVSTLTLYLGANYHNLKIIPSTVEVLNLYLQSPSPHPFNINSLIKDHESTRLKSLSLRSAILLDFEQLPKTMESLDLLSHAVNIQPLIPNTIPRVKELLLPSSIKPIDQHVIPDSVESINLRRYRFKVTPDFFPPSLRFIAVNEVFFNENLISQLPCTIQAIKIFTLTVDYHIRRLDNRHFIIMVTFGSTSKLKSGIVHISKIDKVISKLLSSK